MLHYILTPIRLPCSLLQWTQGDCHLHSFVDRWQESFLRVGIRGCSFSVCRLGNSWNHPPHDQAKVNTFLMVKISNVAHPDMCCVPQEIGGYVSTILESVVIRAASDCALYL